MKMGKVMIILAVLLLLPFAFKTKAGDMNNNKLMKCTSPIQFETETFGPFELMRQKNTASAQDMSKRSQAP